MNVILRTLQRLPRAAIPTGLTLTSMFLGYSAVLSAFHNNLIHAVWLVYLATFLDAADGMAAKTLKATSRFGGEVDSLTDMITFGVAPPLIMYRAYFSSWGLAGAIIGFFPIAFSAMRLARFNTQWSEAKRDYFQGVPTPVSAMLVAGFVAFADHVWSAYKYPEAAAIVALATSFLMISNIPYMSNKVGGGRGRLWKMALFVFSVISVIVWGVYLIFVWSALYTLLGLLNWLYGYFFTLGSGKLDPV